MFSHKPHGLLLLAASLAANVVNALWLLPRSISTGSTALLLSPTFDIEVNGPYPDDLKCAVARILEYIQNDKHGRLVVCCGIGYAEALRSWWYPVRIREPSRLRQELPSVRLIRPTSSISRRMVHPLHFPRTPPSGCSEA